MSSSKAVFRTQLPFRKAYAPGKAERRLGRCEGPIFAFLLLCLEQTNYTIQTSLEVVFTQVKI